MQKKIMLVLSRETEKNGMPKKAFVYAVIAEQFKDDTDFKTVVNITASDDAPNYTRGIRLIKSNSEAEAIEAELNEIRKLFNRDGFQIQTIDVP